MYQILVENWNKSKYLIISTIIIVVLILFSVVFSEKEKIPAKTDLIKKSLERDDLKSFKEFLLNQIKSPYINQNYKIVKGDTIQKILKKNKVLSSEIQSVINQYKKYGKPNQLLVGNEINITIEKNPLSEQNSIINFSVPI